MAEAGSERQCEGTRRGWGPPPIFLDLLILKKFKSSDFGTADSKEVSGANLGSAHSKGVRPLCGLLMKYYTTIANYVNGKVQARTGPRKGIPRIVEAQANRGACSGGGALGVQGQDLLGDLLYVGDAEEGYLDLGNRVVCACCARGENCDVAGAVGALAVLDADDVSGRVGFYGTGAATGDDHDALVGDRVDGVAAFEKRPERREDYAEADQKEGQPE